MTIATKLIDRNAVAIGQAKLYLAPYSSYESNINVALSSDKYFCGKTKVSMEITKSFLPRKGVSGDIVVLLDHILISSDLKLLIEFIEVAERTMDFALGGDGTGTDFLLAALNNPEILRAELKFEFPNKTNYLYVVMPKIQVVTPNVSMDFTPDDAMKVPMELQSIATTHANWSAYSPYGRPIFG